MATHQSLESHHEQHKENVAQILQKIGLPPNKCLLVGSASIAQQYLGQYLRRRPGDLDFYVSDQQIWDAVRHKGKEVAGAIGNSVVQFTIDGYEVEFFHFLPGFPERRLKHVFKNASWQNGILCMSLADMSIWKWRLRQMKERKEYKKKNDWNDIKTAVKAIFLGSAKNLQPAFVPAFSSSRIFLGDTSWKQSKQYLH